MKNLKDLKQEIIDKNIKPLYVFYGEDYGLRHHYIQEIAKSFDQVEEISSALNYANSQLGSGLFVIKTLYIVHSDLSFAKSKKNIIQYFIDKLRTDTFILVYEEELPNSTLFKEFSDYITYFPCVKDNIAIQFVDSEITLNQLSKKEMIVNCQNNYNNILLEADKIRNYAQANNISEQAAYDDLLLQNQLLYVYPEFHSDQLMDDLLKGNYNNLWYWYNLVKSNFQEEFWIATENIFNNYLIAYFIVRYGKYEGGNRAYNFKLPWGRIKAIRDFVIPFKAEDLLETAFQVADLDEQIKLGRIQKEDLFDYFICCIL